MKVAIAKHSGREQIERWVYYCQEKGIDYTIVDTYVSNIIPIIKDCDYFLWYIYHTDYRDMLFAKQLIASIQASGKKTFPNIDTCWHFDDKLGQKYVLEAINAPHIPTHVFYTKKEALLWIKQTSFPKIFKLRGGAGGRNVIFVKNSKQARLLTNRAFGKGFSQTSNSFQYLKDQIRMIRQHKRSIKEGVMKGIGIFFISPEYDKMHGREKGYIMFQDYVQRNDSDWRVIVIGNRLYGMKRKVREGDFRASGSGEYVYESVPTEMIHIAFDTADKLKLQSVAFDFMYLDDKPVIIEMCYGFGTNGSSKCKGFWDRNLIWHEATPDPYYWQIQDLIEDNDNR